MVLLSLFILLLVCVLFVLLCCVVVLMFAAYVVDYSDSIVHGSIDVSVFVVVGVVCVGVVEYDTKVVADIDDVVDVVGVYVRSVMHNVRGIFGVVVEYVYSVDIVIKYDIGVVCCK